MASPAVGDFCVSCAPAAVAQVGCPFCPKGLAKAAAIKLKRDAGKKKNPTDVWVGYGPYAENSSPPLVDEAERMSFWNGYDPVAEYDTPKAKAEREAARIKRAEMGMSGAGCGIVPCRYSEERERARLADLRDFPRKNLLEEFNDETAHQRRLSEWNAGRGPTGYLSVESFEREMQMRLADAQKSRDKEITELLAKAQEKSQKLVGYDRFIWGAYDMVAQYDSPEAVAERKAERAKKRRGCGFLSCQQMDSYNRAQLRDLRDFPDRDLSVEFNSEISRTLRREEWDRTQPSDRLYPTFEREEQAHLESITQGQIQRERQLRYHLDKAAEYNRALSQQQPETVKQSSCDVCGKKKPSKSMVHYGHRHHHDGAQRKAVFVACDAQCVYNAREKGAVPIEYN